MDYTDGQEAISGAETGAARCCRADSGETGTEAAPSLGDRRPRNFTSRCLTPRHC